MTQREKIMRFVTENPGKTTVQIAVATGVKTKNVSAVLIKAVNVHAVKRHLTDAGWQYYPV